MNGQLLALAGPLKTRVAISTAIGLLITACYVLQGLFLAQALAALFTGAAMADVMRWIIAFAGIVILRGFLLWCAEMAAQTTAQQTKEHLRARLLAHLAALGPGVTLRQQTGDLQAVLVAGVEALESYYSRYMPAIFIAILGCAGVLAVLAWIDRPSALLLGAFVIAFPIADRLWLRWRMPKSSGVFAAMGAFGAYLLDSLQGIVTLKAFDATAARRKELALRAANLRQEAMNTLAVTLMRTGLTGFITLIGMALVLSFNSWRTAAGILAPVALFTTLFLMREAFRPLDRLEKEFHTAWAASGAATSVSDFLALQPNIEEPATSAAKPIAHDIAFDDVELRLRHERHQGLVVGLLLHQGERIRRSGRPLGRRQIDGHFAAVAVLRSDLRPYPHRRHQHQRSLARKPALARQRRLAGHLFVPWNDRRQSAHRQAGRDEG
jgi:ATP-binding cassette subfamily C protein CydCD